MPSVKSLFPSWPVLQHADRVTLGANDATEREDFMTAKEAYGKLYRGVLRELTKWADDELVGVYKLAKADAHSEISKLIKAELDRRGTKKGKLAK